MLTLKNLPFFNVVASGVASLELPVGMTYCRIILKLGGTSLTKAMVTRIVGKLNGKIFYDITGPQLDDMNLYKGLTADAAYLTVDFTEMNAKSIGGMYAGAIGTQQGVRSFTLEVTIAGATAPTLESWSQVIEPRPLGLIHACVGHQVSLAASGKYPIVLPYGPEAAHLIKRVHLFHANMTHLTVKKNGIAIFEEMPVAVNEFIQEEIGHVPQTGQFVYDPIYNQDITRAVDTSTAQSMQFDATVSAADTVTAVGEYLAYLPNL